MRQSIPPGLVGLALLALLALVAVGLSGSGVAQAVDHAPPSVTPWPTRTPNPTPLASEATGRALEAPLVATGDAKTGQFPFETCADTWCEEYYNEFWQGGPTGGMVNARRSREITYYWGLDRPMDNVDRDGWAARFRHRVRISTPGIYRFYIYHDDGIKVLINNVSIFGDSLWGDIGPSVPFFNFFRHEVLGNQDLDIEIQFFDSGGTAMLKFWWEFEPSCQIDPTSVDCRRFPNHFSAWRAEYFDSPNLTTGWPEGVSPVWPNTVNNNLVVVRDDRHSGPDFPGQDGPGLYFDWGLGAPAGGVSDDAFAARYSRVIQFGGGHYRFNLRVDDGGRLIIDGNTVIDQWRAANSPRAATTYPIDLYLSPGDHHIVVEFQELVGSATVRLWWEAR